MQELQRWRDLTVAIVCATFLISLSSCGGGGVGGSGASVAALLSATPPSAVGGTIVGLIGSGLVLENDGGDDLAVSPNASGRFVFAAAVAAGKGYAVSVKTQPSYPAQTCTVESASGIARGTPIDDVKVSCTPNQTPANVYAADLNDGSVSSYSVDATTGRLTLLSGPAGVVPGAPGTSSPDSIAMSADKTGKYFVTAATNGTVAAFLGDPATGALAQVASFPNAVPTPYDALVTSSGNLLFLYIASPYADLVSGFAVNPMNGSYAGVPGGAQPAGTGAYALSVDPSGRYLFVADYQAGLTEFSIDPNSGALTQIASVPAGASPVSVAVDPRSRFVYVLNQADASVSTFVFDPTTGALTPSAVTQTPGISRARSVVVSCIAAGPTGNSVYITNSSANSVSSFAIDPVTGALTLVSTVAAETNPVKIVVDPSGRFAYVGNLGSLDISVYSIDPVTGALIDAGPSTPAAGPPISLVVIDH